MTDQDLIRKLADSVDPQWRSYVLNPSKENIPNVTGSASIAYAIRSALDDLANFATVGKQERSIFKVISKEELDDLQEIAVSRGETGKAVGPDWSGGGANVAPSPSSPGYQSGRVPGSGSAQGGMGGTEPYSSGRVPGSGSAQGDRTGTAPTSTTSNPNAKVVEPTPYQEPTTALSADVLLTAVLPFLNAGAREYVNTLRRVGKWQNIMLPAGVTASSKKVLEGFVNGQMVTLEDLTGNGLLANDSNPVRANVQQAIADAKSSGSTLENQRRPYYNPVTSTVEMLTRDEARGIVPRPSNPSSVSVTPAQVAQYVSGAASIEPSELSRMSSAQIQQVIESSSAGPYVPLADGVTEIPGIGKLVSEVILPATIANRPASRVTTDVTTDGIVTAPADQEPVDTGIPKDWEAAAAEMYPEYYAIVKNIPEIADLLRRSLGPPAWSDAKFQAELRKTNWYKTTSDSARVWDTKSAADPASYQAMVDEQAINISTQALNFGIRLSDETAQKLALDSLRGKFGEQQIINSIGMAATEAGSAGATQLREGYYGQSVRQLARRYGVALDSTTFNSFVNRIAVGDETLDSFQDYAMTIAKSLYPPLVEQFNAGRTFEDATSNYLTMAAQVLERDPNSIDMMSPEWVQAVTYMPDTKTGEQRMMNLQEWGNYLRTTDSFGYEFTSQAQSRAYEVADKIANMFGRI